MEKERKKERNAESDNVKFRIFVFHGARPAALLQTPYGLRGTERRRTDRQTDDILWHDRVLRSITW